MARPWRLILLASGVGLAGPRALSQEIDVRGGAPSFAVVIADGDSTPRALDGTDFGGADVPSGTVDRVFRIRNASNSAPLAVFSVTENSPHFAIVSGAANPSIPPFASHDFTVRFQPTAPGRQTATIVIDNNDPTGGESSYTFAIEGTGQADPEIVVFGQGVGILDGDNSPRAADGTDFGILQLNQSSMLTQSFLVRNDGLANLTATVAENSANFRIVEGLGTIAPGNFNDFTVAYDPAATGVHTATVTITNNDPDEGTFTFAIRAEARAPEVEVQGSNLLIADGDSAPRAADGTDFGALGTGNQSVIRYFRVRNVSSNGGPLTITELTENSPHFAITTGGVVPPTQNALVGANSDHEFAIRFDPNSTGVHQATVTIRHDDPDENEDPYTFTIRGEGIAIPEIRVYGGTPPTIRILDRDVTPRAADGTDFGTAIIDETTTTHVFEVRNVGLAPLQVSIRQPSSPDFAIIEPVSSPIAPGGSDNFSVRYDPTASGPRVDGLSITTNDLAQPSVQFAITGFGQTPANPAVDYVWQGTSPVPDWDEPLNWTPVGVPSDSNDTVTINSFIGNSDPTPTLVTHRTIESLTMDGGATLDLDGYTLSAQETTTVTGAGLFTSLLVRDGTLRTDNLVIRGTTDAISDNPGRVTLGGGTVEVGTSAIISPLGELRGDGTFRTGPGSSMPFVNNGCVLSLRNIGAATGRLTIARDPSSTARFDWDGTDNNQVELFVGYGSTLDIEMPLADTTFNGTIKLSGESTLDTSGFSYSLGGQRLDADPGVLTKQSSGFGAGIGTLIASSLEIDGPGAPGLSGGLVYVTGGTLVLDSEVEMHGGTISISAGTSVHFDGPCTVSGGTIANTGTLEFNADAIVSSQAIFNMTGIEASLTVGPGTIVTIDNSSFDLDGADAPTNRTAIGAGGVLDLNLNNAGADDSFGHTVGLAGGRLDVRNAADNQPWTLNSNSTVNATGGVSTIVGDELNLYSGDINVASGATLRVLTDGGPATSPTTNSEIAAGGILDLGDRVEFRGGRFEGEGTLRVGSSTFVTGVNIVTKTFDWDGTSAGDIHTINEGVFLTIYSERFEVSGENSMDDEVHLAGDATLRIEGPAQWIKDGGPIDTNTTQTGRTILRGSSELLLRSTLNVMQETIVECPFVTEGTINVEAGADLVITAPDGMTFNPGSATNIAGVFDLANGHSIISAGAQFTGGGVLRNTGILSLRDGSVVDVRLENNTTLLAGTVTAKDFVQDPTSSLRVAVDEDDSEDEPYLTLTGSATLDGTLKLTPAVGFRPSLGDVFTIIRAAGGIAGQFETIDYPLANLDPGLEWRASYNAISNGAPTQLQLEVVSTGSAYAQWIDSFSTLTDPSDKTKGANPDSDKLSNHGEFGLDGDPASAVNDGKVVHKIAPVGSQNVLTLTFPVRLDALPSPGDLPGGELILAQPADGVTYTVQAGGDLQNFGSNVSEVIGAEAEVIQAGMPAVSAGWEYRSFHAAGPVTSNPAEFMRVVVSE